jgi:type I restriction enzyme, S subunit
MSELPEGWEKSRLSKLCSRIVDGSHNPPQAVEFGKPMLSARNIQRRTILFDDYRFISELDFALEQRRTQIGTNDVLLTIVGTIGRVAVVKDDTPEFALQRSVAVLRPGLAIAPQYLGYVLESPRIQQHFIDTAKGTAQKGVYLKALGELELELAPLAEQVRIVNQLDTLLTRVQACNDRFDAIPALLKRFRQTVLAEATAGALTEAEETAGSAAWTETNIGAVSSDLRYGTSKKCDYSTQGTGVLRIPNIAERGRIDITDLKRAEFDSNELEKLALREGDLLVIRSNGSVELVGKTGLVTAHETGLLFAGYLMRLRVDPEKALPAFIQICLSAPIQRQYIERTAKSTSGVNNLNAEELRAVPLLLPSLSKQIEIVRRVEALFTLADHLEARCTAALTQAQRLSPLVLAKAFRGELVPQDPSDEPATTLLARLSAQQGDVATPAKTRQPRKPRAVAAIKESTTMTKSRQDDDVKGKPYLSNQLRRIGTPTSAEALFKVAELPVADFYKQLAWEVDQGLVKDSKDMLEPRNAA